MSSLKFSVAASILTQDPREAPQLSREAGFSGLQFDAYGPALRIPDLSGTGRREFRRLLANQNQELVGLRIDLGAKGFGPGADVDQLLSGLDRAMEAATALAAPLVCVDLGRLPEPPRAATPKPKVTPEQAGIILLPESIAPPKAEAPASPPPDPALVAQIDAALGELGAKADRYSVILAFRSELSSFAAIEESLRRVRCPWFGIDLDPVAVLRDEWPMDEVFSRLGGFVRHVLGRDATRGSDRRTKPAIIGRGDTSWGDLLASLDGAGYACWLTIDPVELSDRRGAAIAGHGYLRKLAE